MKTMNPYRFAGYERDAESGKDYVKARYYSASQGRWQSPDPLGDGFEYAFNNPANLNDPTGLGCWKNCVQINDGPIYCRTICDGDGGAGTVGGSSTVSTSGAGIVEGGGTQPLGPPLPPPVKKIDFTLGVRAPDQTYKDCLAANLGNYSIGGLGTLLGIPHLNSAAGGLLLGNDVGNILFGHRSEGATGLALAEGGSRSFAAGVGNPLTYGRRTASIMAANLNGVTGPAPRILGKTAASGIARWLTGLAEAKLAIDVALTAAELVNCSMIR